MVKYQSIITFTHSFQFDSVLLLKHLRTWRTDMDVTVGQIHDSLNIWDCQNGSGSHYSSFYS